MNLKTILSGVLMCVTSALATSDYSAWSHSRDIVINPSALGLTAPVTNFPVLIRLSEAAGTFTFSESQSTWTAAPTAPPTKLVGSGGGDIRFTDVTGTDAARTDLSYQIESWDGTGKTAEIWVLVPSISNTTATTIKMYWGMTGQTTVPASHNGTVVFSRSNVSTTGCESNLTCGFVSTHHLVTSISTTPSVSEPSATGTSTSTFAMQDKSTTGIASVANGNIIGYASAFSSASSQAYGINSSKNDSATNFTRSNFTLSAWVNQTSATTARIFSKSGQYHLGINSSGLAEFEYDNNPKALTTAGACSPQIVTSSLSSGWNYIVAVRSGSSMGISVNGSALSLSSPTAGTAFTLAGVQTVSVGYESGDGASIAKGSYLNGSIDEPRIENVARNSDWIRLNYETQKASVTAVTYSNAPTTVATPVASPASTSFSGTQLVTLSTTTSGADIYYTTDGSTPVAGGATTTKYTAAISLTSTTTLKAIAVLPYLVSGIMSETYTLAAAPLIAYSPTSFTDTTTKTASHAVTSTGGSITSCSVTSGTLPATYSIDNSCLITTTGPTATLPSTPLTITATGPGGTGTANITLTIVSATVSENYALWPYYKNITVNTSASGAKVTGNVINFPVLVRLTSANTDVFSNALSTGADIRFTKADGLTPLKYQIERYDAPNKLAEFWVKMDTVFGNNSSQSIRMYWGKADAADSSKPSAVFDTSNGFQGVWHLSEATNDTARDATVNKYVGTPATTGTAGNPFDTTGVIGRAKSFRVTTNASSAGTAGAYYAMAGTASGKLNLAAGTAYTLSAWVYAYDASNSGKVVSKGDKQYYLGKRSSGTVFEFMEFKAATSQNTLRFSTVAGQWKYLTGVRFGPPTTTGAAAGAFYLDTTLSTTFGSGSAGSPSAVDVLNIGRDPGQPTGTQTYYFGGGIDEVTISNVARSADWVKLSFQTQKIGANCLTLGATQSTTPPSNLSYSVPSAIYGKGVVITSNTPTVTGIASAYSISPDLAANTGLTFNTSTGVISGTPTKTSRSTNYTVTASNNNGSTTATVNIQVNGFVFTSPSAVYTKNSIIQNNALTSDSVGAFTGFSSSPALPAGLSITVAGTITGTPTAASSATSYVITGTFAGGSATATVNIRVEAENYSQWNAYKTLTVNTSSLGLSGSVTGFPMLVRLTSGDADVFNNALVAKGGDIRFTKADGITHLSYQRERWDAVNKVAEFWVLMDSVYANNSTQSIRMYYGKTGAADSSKGSAVFATSNNFVGVWHMEGDSSNVADATGAGFFGANYGTTNATGMTGVARSFVRTSPTVGQFIRIFGSGNNNKFDVNMTQTTLSLWVNGTDWGSSLADRAKIICRGTSSFKYELLDTTFDGSSYGMWWAVNPTAGNNGSLVKTPGSLSLGAWHLIHGTFNPSASNISLYVDGAFVASTTGSTAYALSPWDVHLGARGYGSSPGGTEDHFFNGMIDEVRMQGVARNADWIALDYATQKSDQSVVTGSGGISQAPPSNYSYSAHTSVYGVGIAITANTHSITGVVNRYSINPDLSLNTGLTFDTTTGVISGTPATVSSATNYVVTATNSAGSVYDTLNISVLAFPSNLSYEQDTVTYRVGTPIAANHPSITGTVTHYVTDSLPAGLTLDSVTGIITGTPSAQHSAANYRITASNPVGFTAHLLNMTVQEMLPIVSYAHTVVNATKGVTLAPDSIVSAGGPVTTYSINPSLPSGLHIDSLTGVISGTPSTTSVSTAFIVTGTGPGGSDTALVNISVQDTAPNISYKRSSISGIRNVAIVPDTVTTTTGSGAISNYGLSSGSVLPSGLSLDSLTGVISGTPTAVSSAINDTIIATGPGGTGIAVVTIGVQDTAPNISYKQSTLSAIKSVAIVPDTVVIGSGSGAITGYSISPSLPNGLLFNTVTGIISGIPLSAQTSTAFTVTATGPGGAGLAVITLSVTDATPVIAYKRTSISGIRNVAILADTIVSTGGSTTSFTVLPVLPTGLSLNSETGVITGIPSVVSASTNYVVTGTGIGGSDTAVVTIVVQDTAPNISYNRLNISAIKGVSIVPDTVVISSGSGAITGYSVSPVLPLGLLLDTLSGRISGTPLAMQVSTPYNVTASGPGGAGVSIVNISVDDSAPILSYKRSTISGMRNVAVLADTIVSTGGSATSFTVLPTLPVGLVLNANTGVISGVPSIVSVSANYVVTGTGFGGSDTALVTIAVTDTAPAIAYKHGSVISVQNVAVTPDTVVSTGGAITGYSVLPSLPSGLSLDPGTGLIYGTPTVASSASNYTVTAIGPGGTGISVVNITVLAPPVISYKRSSMSATRGVSVLPDTVISTGGSITGYSVNPSLPAGLSLDALTGLLSGTPTVVSSSANYTVSAAGPGGVGMSVLTILVVDTAPAFSYVHSSSIYLKNQAVSANTVVSRGGVVNVFHVSPPLPSGLMLDSVTGAISGTSTDTSVSTVYTVTGTGPGGSGTTTVTIAVSSTTPPPLIVYAQPSPTYVKHVAITVNTIVSSGGPVNVYHVSPALPSGLSLDTVTGSISGTPSGTSSSTVHTVIASGPGALGTVLVTIAVSDTSPSIAYKRSSISGTKNVTILADTIVVNGTGVITGYALSGGSTLPAGVTLSETNGVISGTPTATFASKIDTVIASGPGGAGRTTVVISVSDTSPSITYKRSSISGVKNVSIIPDTIVLIGTGAITSYSVLPALPAGLSLNTSSGVISGTPTSVSSSSGYTVTASGPGGMGISVVTIAVNDTSPSVSYKRSSISGTKNIAILADSIVVTGSGAVTGYALSTGSTLPDGVSLNSSSGIIAGTPTSTFASAMDTIIATGPGGTGRATVTIVVNDTSPSIVYKRASIVGTKNVAIPADSIMVTGSGAITGYVLSGGSTLPAGVSLGALTGVISGTPTATFASRVDTVVATGPGGTGRATVTMAVSDTAPAISYKQSSISGLKSVAITPDTVVVLGTGAITGYSVNPSLPAGLTLNALTGLISGIPTVASASAAYTVSATGPGGVGTSVVSILIQDAAPQVSYRRALLEVQRAVAITPDSIVSTGGAVTRYWVSPSLPSGLVLDTVSGILSGTPTVQQFTSSYTVTATGPGGTGTTVVGIGVFNVPSNFSYADDPSVYVLGVAGTPNVPSVSGFITRFSVSPALPAGLRLDSVSGVISGTATGTQHFSSNYVVTAANPVGSTTVTINVGVVGAPSNLSYPDDVPTYALNAAITPPNVPTIQGIVTLYSVTPSLPTGIVFDQTTGYIQGTPTAVSASNNYTVTGQNPGGSTSTLINVTVITVP